MIAAQQRENGFSIGHHDEALDLRSFRQTGEFGDFGYGLAARRMELLGRGVGVGIVDRRRHGVRNCLFEIRRIVTAGAIDDEVFACVRSHHEFHRLAAAHGARMRFDRNDVEAAAGEDPAIRVVVFLVGNVETFGVEIEGVGILHDELPHAQ